MPRFADMLHTTAADIKAPPLLPMGRYFVLGKKHPSIDPHVSKTTGVNFDRIRFEMVVQDAVPDTVDPDQLAEYGKVQGTNLRRDFYYNTEEDEDRSRAMTEEQIKEFLLAFGCWSDPTMTLQEAMANFPNAQAQIDVVHRPNPTDPSRFNLEIGRAYAV